MPVLLDTSENVWSPLNIGKKRDRWGVASVSKDSSLPIAVLLLCVGDDHPLPGTYDRARILLLRQLFLVPDKSL